MKTIESLANQIAPSDELVHLRSKCSELESRLSGKKATSGQIGEAMDGVLAEVKTFRPPPLAKLAAQKGSGKPVTHCVHASDWHVGQKTNPAHIEEFGDYSMAIAEERVNQFTDRVIDKTERMRLAYDVPECHVLGTADWVSGDIHDELSRTNEVPAPVQAVRAGYMLGGMVSRLAGKFPRVIVDAITAGNHDRITRKPQMEDGGLNSWGYVACEIARQACSALPNVRFNVHTALSAVVMVCGVRYLVSHGDGIMGTWGIPFYGVERLKQREAMARMNMPEARHFDKIVIGHFHTALNHEHWMIGGSLSGTTALDHKVGRHSKPHQTSWFVHPTHREFDWTRWSL